MNLPSRFNSNTTIGLAQTLAKNLGCLYTEVSIEDSVELTKKQLQGLKVFSLDGKISTELQLSTLVLENIQARDRSSRVLAAIAASFCGVFTCNANKAEMTVGYSTLYGDLGGFLAVLGDLWKKEIYALGKYVNEKVFQKEMIPEGTFTIVPSAELSAQQAVDEGKGDPLNYPYHDQLFFSWVQRWNRATPEEILEWYLDGSLMQKLNCDEKFVDLNKLISHTDHIHHRSRKMVESCIWEWVSQNVSKPHPYWPLARGLLVLTTAKVWARLFILRGTLSFVARF